MTVTYEQLMALRADNQTFSYSAKDTILYALSIGLGRDPLNLAELDFVFEGRGPRVVPSQAAVVGRRNILLGSGIDRAKSVHGEQRLTFHRPLPPAADCIANMRVTEVLDKGAGKGAVIYIETVVTEAASGEKLFTGLSTTFARGDGGCGGPDAGGLPPHEVPARRPEMVVDTATRPDQALLYRLNGDFNPLHADPELARKVGFKGPILHGLCTYGIACQQILASVCAYDESRIAGFDVRFSAPVYPGDVVTTEIWVDGTIVSFQSFCRVRDARVLSHGKCVLN